MTTVAQHRSRHEVLQFPLHIETQKKHERGKDKSGLSVHQKVEENVPFSQFIISRMASLIDIFQQNSIVN